MKPDAEKLAQELNLQLEAFRQRRSRFTRRCRHWMYLAPLLIDMNIQVHKQDLLRWYLLCRHSEEAISEIIHGPSSKEPERLTSIRELIQQAMSELKTFLKSQGFTTEEMDELLKEKD